MKKILIISFIVILMISGVSYLTWSEDNSVPGYILEDYALGDRSLGYKIISHGDSNSLEITTQKGKGEFLVKDSNNYSSYIEKQVYVEGEYILDDGKVTVVIKEIEALEQNSLKSSRSQEELDAIKKIPKEECNCWYSKGNYCLPGESCQ